MTCHQSWPNAELLIVNWIFMNELSNKIYILSNGNRQLKCYLQNAGHFFGNSANTIRPFQVALSYLGVMFLRDIYVFAMLCLPAAAVKTPGPDMMARGLRNDDVHGVIMLLDYVDLEYVHADAFANYINITVSVKYGELWVFSVIYMLHKFISFVYHNVW